MQNVFELDPQRQREAQQQLRDRGEPTDEQIRQTVVNFNQLRTEMGVDNPEAGLQSQMIELAATRAIGHADEDPEESLTIHDREKIRRLRHVFDPALHREHDKAA